MTMFENGSPIRKLETEEEREGEFIDEEGLLVIRD